MYFWLTSFFMRYYCWLHPFMSLSVLISMVIIILWNTIIEYYLYIVLVINSTVFQFAINNSYKLNPYHINRLSIQDPNKFNPERWAPENPEAEKLKELYFPFSLGKRNCVGQNLASLQTKLVLASVFKSYRFELQSAVEADYFLTLKAVAAVKVYDAIKY